MSDFILSEAMAFIIEEQDLHLISTKTISHYDQNAPSFWEGTKDHDVSQNYQALLGALPQQKALTILDLGCGPGRDLKYFKTQGHEAIGLEGSYHFCQMARDYSGCEVWQQDFLHMELPAEKFDGIFANASLFHVPSRELPRVLRQLADALKPQGILFSSNPRGNWEGWSENRYAHYMELSTYQNYLEQAGLVVLHHYYRPSGLPCEKQPWLAVVSQKK